MAAIRKAKDQGALTLGIVNVVGSSIARETHCGVYIHAGPEIGVASTKAFTAQVVIFNLIGLLLAQSKGLGLNDNIYQDLINDLDRMPNLIQEVLDGDKYKELVKAHEEERFDDISYCKNCDQLWNVPESLIWTNIEDVKYNHSHIVGDLRLAKFS